MDEGSPDSLSALVARQRGRSRLRAATIALGAGSLVAAGAVAYTLPGATHPATTGAQAAGASATHGAAPAAHTVSGGSGVAAAPVSGAGSGGAQAPAASTGYSHAASGGS